MKDIIYKLIEITGTSTRSMEDAVNTALKRAGKTIQNLGWFQIVKPAAASRRIRLNMAGYPQGRVHRRVSSSRGGGSGSMVDSRVNRLNVAGLSVAVRRNLLLTLHR